MCGIAGILAYGRGAPKPSLPELHAIREAMVLRGPDGARDWSSPNGEMLFGHRRLAIQDLLDRALQPMISADERFAIVFNGEIYNTPELRQKLEAQGAAFRTTSDTEVVMQLYARKGPAALDDLRGMYGLAIWDEREKTMFLARDPYGIKPLYYADDGRTIRFASQVKALMAGGGVPAIPDPAGLAGFCLLGSVPEPYTIYKTVKLLPAGHAMLVKVGEPKAEPRQHASVTAVLAQGPAAVSPGEAKERIQAALKDSVAKHMLADVEVGVFLSSGVDSGALLGLMRDVGQPRPRAITLGFAEFEGTAADETPLAREIAARYGANHVVRRVDAQEFRADADKILAAMDQPSIDGVNTWFVSKAAKEAGLKVAISGVGGDELLAGYSTFDSIPKLVSSLSVPAAIPGVGWLSRALGGLVLPWLSRDNPKALSVLEFGGSYPGAYLLRRGLFMPHEVASVLGPDMAREGLAQLDPLNHIAAVIPAAAQSPLSRVGALEASLYMRNQLLRDTDWAGMAHSVEVRTPLVDYELLKSLAPVLPQLAGRFGKQCLGAAPSQPLPASIVDRPKTGFGIPVGAWQASLTGAKADQGPGRLISRRWAAHVLAQVPGLHAPGAERLAA
jgi:asparagine synthase (glutamine-hydrolysing)